LEHGADREYGDVMERAFYNTVLAGMQLDGTKFFYVNPLEIVPGISGVSPTHKHDLPQRPGWYACACCPPNTARLISSFGKYAYSENERTAFCHLYADGEICFENGLKLECRTEYPYGFDIRYKVTEGSGELAVRIPAWSESSYHVLLNGQALDAEKIRTKLVKGYLYLEVQAGDEIVLQLDPAPYRVYASTKVPRLTGCVSICRGPLVYCFEGADNEGDVLSLSVCRGGELKAEEYDGSLLNGTVMLKVDAVRAAYEDNLYTIQAPEEKLCQAKAIPYYTWGNRGLHQMRVWMNEVR